MAYSNNWIDDGKIWAYYDVTTTESATTLIGATTGIGGTMNVDGVDVTRATSYTFSTTGIHLVKFTPTTTYIGRGVFKNIARIVELYLPSTITRTDGANDSVNCINGCANLVTIGISNSFKNVYAHDFKNLSLLTEIKNYEVIKTIGNYAFQSLPNWNVELNLPNLTSLGERAFMNTGITKILNLGSITTILGGANSSNAPFLNCSKLTDATLPATLTTITQFSFYNCAKLKRLTMLSVTPPSLGSNAFRGTTSLDVILVPAESVEAYKTASGWSYWSSKIYPIGDEKRLNINNMSLGDFRRRIMLGISKPKPLYPDPYIDDGKVWCYYNVTTTESTTRVFNNTTGISEMWVDGVQVSPVVRDYQFVETGEHLVKITFSNSSYVGGAPGNNWYQTWRDVGAIRRVYIPEGVTVIKGLTFYGNSYPLEYLRLPTTLLSFGENDNQAVFYSAYSLRIKVNLQNVTYIARSGFQRTGITKAVISGPITAVNNDVFRSCPNLTLIDLPSTVTSIGSQFGYDCGKLKTVTIRATTPPTLAGNNFWHAYALTAIYVPSESVEDYKAASGWSSYANKIQAIPE